jgi:hypothetical protein
MAILSLLIYPQIHIHYTKPFEPDYTYCWIVATAIIVVSELWKLWIENMMVPSMTSERDLWFSSAIATCIKKENLKIWYQRLIHWKW